MGSLLIAIDEQNSFMDGGELGVPGSLADVGRLCGFIRENAYEISKIIVSLDTHEERQIFHPVWWKNADGNPPPPFTMITLADIERGVWTPAFFPTVSVDYVRNLERLGRKKLIIWPLHCIKGTKGHELEPRFAEAIRPFPVEFIKKGQDHLSEMYGIIKPEYSRWDIVNLELLNSLHQYEKIYIAGEAASHCVLESVKQIVEHFADDAELKSKIHVLTDCMSSIPGFEAETEREFAELARVHGIKLIKTGGLPLDFIKQNIMGPNPVKLLEELLGMQEIPSGTTVLDLGCGKGVTSMFMAKKYGCLVFATDLWIGATENKERFESMGFGAREIVPIHADAHDLPFAHEFFDAVVSIDSFHYFGHEDGYLEKILLPFVKRGGYLLFAVPGLKTDFHDDISPEMLLSWSAEDISTFRSTSYWTKLLEKTDGIEIVSVCEMKGFDECWRDWLECENEYAEYAARDRVAMNAGAGKYMNFLAMILRRK